MSKLFVVIATVGRPDLTAKTVGFLDGQSRRADGIVVVSVTPEDVTGVDRAAGAPEVIFTRRGLCRQRNRSLDHLAGRADIIVFLDDDFVPASDFLAEVEAIFDARQDVAGLTGELIADGIHNRGYDFAEAVAMVEGAKRLTRPSERSISGLYGCNMAIRTSAAAGLRFDEALPLYGWQEDVDFTMQLGRRGLLLKTGRLRGVHMGTKGGRDKGKRTGYSQVANLIHLRRKRTIPPILFKRLMLQNLTANLVRSVYPEPHIDRRGRLLGNLVALRDLVRGRIDPRRIESM